MAEQNRKLILEDGSEYYGTGFGADRDAVCEIVFNTSMVGYQEIASDLSYTDQAVVMSYPLIGNYGITDEDFESKGLGLGALIVRDYNDLPSNFRYTRTLSELLEENQIPGVAGVDTRKLVRSIRDLGSRRVLITQPDVTVEEGLRRISETPIPHDAVSRVSCKRRWYARTANPKYRVVAIDCGMKTNIVRMLNRFGCNVTVVPYDTTAEEIRFMNPDGVFALNPFRNGQPRISKGKYTFFKCSGNYILWGNKTEIGFTSDVSSSDATTLGAAATIIPVENNWKDVSYINGTYWMIVNGVHAGTNYYGKARASSEIPPMDSGNGARGNSTDFARANHVHPSDTSRVPITRTINNKALDTNITLTASDVGAEEAKLGVRYLNCGR